MGKHIKTFDKVTDYLRAKGTFTERHVAFIRETNYVDFGDYDNSNLNEFGLEGDLIITAESNPPVFAALNDAGIPYDTTAGGYTIADLAAITDEDLMPLDEFGEASEETTVFFDKPIVNFNEFKYFTGIDGTCFYNSPNDVPLFGYESILKKITIPKNISCDDLNLRMGLYYCPLEYIVVEEENQLYDSRNNCNAIINTETNILIRASKNTVITNTVTELGELSFGNLPIITITIPSNITTIGESAFNRCTSLTNITIPTSVTTIGNGAFINCTSLNNITIPTSVTSIGNSTFSDCTSLSNITIPTTVTTIGYYTFSGCTSLTNITIPNSVTTIGNYAFSGCTSLNNITIPTSVTTINYSTFNRCTSLTNITIPNSVTTIGDYAFNGCTSLNNITCNATNPPTVSNNTFKDVGSKGVLTVPTASETAYLNGWIKGFTNYYLGKYGWIINDIVLAGYTNGALYNILNENDIPRSCSFGYRISDLGNITNDQILSYAGQDTEESSDDTCYSIFYQASGLNSFEEFQYFTGISHDITTKTNSLIGNVGFFEGTSISKIVLPPHLSVIGEKCFYCLPINEITIPPSVTKIMYNAFAGCGFTKIELPSSVRYIGERSLACTNLTEIICKGTTAPQYDSYYNNPSPFGNDANNSTAHVPRNGILKYPAGADYSVLLSTTKYYLGYFGWTGEEF